MNLDYSELLAKYEEINEMINRSIRACQQGDAAGATRLGLRILTETRRLDALLDRTFNPEPELIRRGRSEGRTQPF